MTSGSGKVVDLVLPSRPIVIIDARLIANTYYYEVAYARPGMLSMRRSISSAFER